MWLLRLGLLGVAAGLLPAQQSPAADERAQQLYGEAKVLQSRGDLAGAVAKYELLIQQSPKLAPAYNNLGSLYLQQREYARAAAILEKGLKLDPSMTSASALLGVAFYETGEYAKARAPLEAALKANPRDDRLELILVKSLVQNGDFPAAERHLGELTRKQPNNQELWYLLAQLHMRLSEQALARMNAIDPASVWAHELSGEVMESMANHDGAVVELQKAISIAPNQAGLHYKLGNVFLNMSKWDAAAEQYQAELALNPAHCRARWKLGSTILENSGDPDAALKTVDAAFALCPNLAEARYDRARALIRLNRNQEAAQDLELAVRANPSDAANHFLLAKTYRALGRREQAQEEMKAFTRLDEAARAAVAGQAAEVIRNKEAGH